MTSHALEKREKEKTDAKAKSEKRNKRVKRKNEDTIEKKFEAAKFFDVHASNSLGFAPASRFPRRGWPRYSLVSTLPFLSLWLAFLINKKVVKSTLDVKHSLEPRP